MKTVYIAVFYKYTILFLKYLFSFIPDYIATNKTTNITIPFKASDVTQSNESITEITVTVMTVNNWILIQQRVPNDSSTKFNKSWAEYKDGFGTFTGNYWFGNEKAHQLTSSGTYKLRVEMLSATYGRWTSVEYNTFSIANESEGYAIKVSGYSGDDYNCL